jgi:hypothetical protein
MLDQLSDYLRTLRADFTRDTYASSIGLVVGDGNGFLAVARRKRKQAEDQLIEYIISSITKIKGCTIAGRLAEQLFEHGIGKSGWRRPS